MIVKASDNAPMVICVYRLYGQKASLDGYSVGGSYHPIFSLRKHVFGVKSVGQL